LFQAPYGGTNATWQGIRNASLNFNVTNYTALEFDVKIKGAVDQYGQIQQLQPLLQSTYNGWMQWGGPALSAIATNNGWQHIIIPASGIDGGNITNWANIYALELDVYDGNYTNAQTMVLGYANIAFTGGSGSGGSTNAVTPQFSGLPSSTITTYGTTGVSLSGKVSTNGAYLPSGTAVTVTVDGNAQQTTISDSIGDFSLGYNTVGIPASATAYPVTYTSAAASGFNPATNTSTTMTINRLPVVLSGSMPYNGTTTVPASDLTVANLVSGGNLTLSGTVQIAGTNVGPENITSFSGLTLGGASAANYTLTGASGSVTLTSPGQGGVTNWIGVFKSASDIAGWVDGGGNVGTGVNAALSFAAGDAPPWGPSTGALVATAPVTPSGIWAVIGTNLNGVNLTNYTQLEFDVKAGANQTEWNIYGYACNNLSPVVEYGSPGNLTVAYGPQPPIPPAAAYNGWQHMVFPASDFGATTNLSSVQWFQLEMISGGFPANGTMVLEFANFEWDTPPSPTATVSVNASQTVRIADSRWFAMNAGDYDYDFNVQHTVPEAQAAGWTMFRYPGGTVADTFNWANFLSSGCNNTVNNFVQVVTNLGAQLVITSPGATIGGNPGRVVTNLINQPIIGVNYGTGTPQEAAAWVAWANVTNHLGWKYWEIGNEVYAVPTEVDNNPYPHDPWSYGTNAATYIQKMKAVDPTIKCGVFVVQNAVIDNNGYTNNTATNLVTGQVFNGWNPVLLSAMRRAGVAPDFVIYHWYPEPFYTGPQTPDDDEELLASDNWAADAAEIRGDITDFFGPAGTNIEILITENNNDQGTPGKQSVSVVNALYYADSLGQIAQTEFNARVWWQLHDGNAPYTTGDLTNSLYGWRQYGAFGAMDWQQGLVMTNRYPPFFAAELVHHFIVGGDTVVSTTSGNPLVSAYGAVRTNGNLSLMLINKSLTLTNYTENIMLNNYSPLGSTATVYSYGIPQDNLAKAANNACDITTNTISVGASFNYTIQPYSINVFNFTH
jgi:hypothetical protein